MSQNDEALQLLIDKVASFNRSRNWGRFHTPKNLACAISVESGELLELFQWLTPEQSDILDPEYLESIIDEIADILIFVFSLVDRLNIDASKAVLSKIERNQSRFPVDGEFNPFAKG